MAVAHPRLALALLVALGAVGLRAQAPAIAPTPNLAGNIERPLRYRPDNGDFVIENGAEFFNRPLYGGNTGFRVDAGDKPEFTLYLPGRGGNLRLGFKTAAGTKWLFEAASVTSRYRPGAMLYEVRDPLLGASGVIEVEVLALAASEGLIARVDTRGAAAPLELVWAYGGINGQRGVRDGDIGTESVPIGEYFQLKPEFARNNVFSLAPTGFTVVYTPPAPARAAGAPAASGITIVGTVPPGSTVALADAARWSTWEQLAASTAGAQPVAIGRVGLKAGEPRFVALQRTTGSDYADLAGQFVAADQHFRELRDRVRIDTPDPYLNAAVGALNVAVDAVWDEAQSSVMHGAVAWRQRLLGWRGPYAQDALGWHDRARRNFAYWTGRQNTNPIPTALPPLDENANLARAEAALHSNGDMSNSHYDMNAVFIDALFRHLRWTGDLDFAREMWPVIERYLAWERRMFRRPFGPVGAPLYEAYAMIWASDDLGYNGGGVTHASAYNYAHNTIAAELARKLGYDPAPYEAEAGAIAAAMRKYLWLPDQGMFAEYKDLLGNQAVHPSAALWTFYHTMDSGLPSPSEAWQMTRYVDQQLPHIPVRGPGVPADDDYHVLPSTIWMPYSWSINNVVMGEVVHTALGFWQAGRADEANRLLKGSLLASMYMGICPGNVGSMNYLDVYRRESQRDFADGGGVLSRAVIEGLFGVKPDLLAGIVNISPGFPESWDHASLHHPEIDVAFRRDGRANVYTIEPHFAKPVSVVLTVPAWRTGRPSVVVDGRVAVWNDVSEGVGNTRIQVEAGPGSRHVIEVILQGQPIEPGVSAPGYSNASPTALGVSAPGYSNARSTVAGGVDPGSPFQLSRDWTALLPITARLDPIDLTPAFNDRVTQIFKNQYRTPRSPYVSLSTPKQGIGAWAGHVNATAEIDDRGLRAAAGGGRFVLPDGLPFATPGPGDAKNVIFTSQWDNYPRDVRVPLAGRASHAFLLMAGSTDFMQSRIDNGEIVVAYTDGTTARLALSNPENWWPIDQDYFIDDFQFRRPGPIPPRVDLKTGAVRILDPVGFAGKGGVVPGGAASVLEMPLDPAKTLQSLTVRALANEVVVGLMAVTLER